jgi:hypothetical protein
MIFTTLSIITHQYLIGNLSTILPIFYQIFAFTGLGQMYVTYYVFKSTLDTRNMLGLSFFIFAAINVGVTLINVKKVDVYYHFKNYNLTWIKIRGKRTWRLRDKSGKFVKGAKELFKAYKTGHI